MTDQHDSVLHECFEQIYAADLVYVPECFKLCGDAHCCGSPRGRRTYFKIALRKPTYSLPLLPGEYEFLERKGWLGRFGDVSHDVRDFVLDDRVLRVEQLSSPRPGCMCRHDSRLATCRLYPLLPIFAIDGRITGIDTRYGSFDELEALAGVERICQVSSLAFDQIPLFYSIANAIASQPLLLFHVMAYRLAKEHVRHRLGEEQQLKPGHTPWSVYESMIVRGRLLDVDALRASLTDLAERFESHYGERFALPRVSRG